MTITKSYITKALLLYLMLICGTTQMNASNAPWYQNGWNLASAGFGVVSLGLAARGVVLNQTLNLWTAHSKALTKVQEKIKKEETLNEDLIIELQQTATRYSRNHYLKKPAGTIRADMEYYNRTKSKDSKQKMIDHDVRPRIWKNGTFVAANASLCYLGAGLTALAAYYCFDSKTNTKK